MHQSREMDWQRTTNVFVFLLLVIVIAVAIGAMMWTLLPRPSQAQEIPLDDETVRALKDAFARWQVCPDGQCRQSRVELEDGTVLIWVRDLYAGQFDNIDPATRSWFKGVKAPSGVPCCDIADGHRVQEDLRGNSHWAFFEGQWREIPPEAVVYNAGNPVGEAVVWYVRQGPDAVYVRCFVPGGGV